MNIADLKSSKFLTKHDVEPPVLVTIKGCEQMDVSMESQAQELKWVLHFHEVEKPLILNVTNGRLIAGITHSEESDGWIGKQIMLYNDPNIMFAGKLTGGIRVRPVNRPEDRKNPNYVGEPLPEDTTDHSHTREEIPF